MTAKHRHVRAAFRETPEDARKAIASALEFLRQEAAALGMRDVSTLIALARSCILENDATDSPSRR